MVMDAGFGVRGSGSRFGGLEMGIRGWGRGFGGGDLAGL